MQPEQRDRLLHNTFVDFQQMSAFAEDPLIFSRAEGLYCWDIHGKRYFDAIGGIFVAVLGHRPPAVLAAIRRQMDEITFGAPLHGISETTLRLNEKLASVTPGNLKYVKSFSGGSESVEASLKFARQYFKQTGSPGKYKVISLYLSYHGATFAAMAASGNGKRKVKFEPQMPGFVKVFSPIQLRDWFPSWEEANRFGAHMVEQTIVNENPETVAAVLIEPICNTAGIVAPTTEYLATVREACSRHNVLLVFDEVLTGFGRTGDMFAAQTFGVTPDILCSGKGLSGGVIPMGAMIARESLGDAFYGAVEEDIQFFHGHTFAGQPPGCGRGHRRHRGADLEGPAREGADARSAPAGTAGGPEAARRRARGARERRPPRRRAGGGCRHQPPVPGGAHARCCAEEDRPAQRAHHAHRSGLVCRQPAADRRRGGHRRAG